MSYLLTLHTGKYLAEQIARAYRAGHKDINAKTIDTIGKPRKRKYSNNPRPVIEIDYTSTDTHAIKNMKIQAFQVANVGVYELQEKLKELAIDVTTNKNQDIKAFKHEARKLIAGYVKLDDIPPEGYLQQNYLTAVKSAFSGSQWIRLNDPAVKSLYPAVLYMTRRDKRVRPAHEKLDGNIYLMNDPILKYIWAPNDYGCRCSMLPQDADDIKGKKLQSKPLNDEQIKNFLDEAGVGKDFRFNPGDMKSIWHQWLNSKLKEMNVDKIYNDMKAYANANKIDITKIPGIDKEQLKKVNDSLGKHQPKPQKDYDRDLIFVNAAPEVRPLIGGIISKPHEVWGKTFKTGDTISHEIHYIQFTSEGISVALVSNGVFKEMFTDSAYNINKYRKGNLIEKGSLWD